jgi:hypothetical protein
VIPGEVDATKTAEVERIGEPARAGRTAAMVEARVGRSAATVEARRTDAAIEPALEWYWRDAWLFSSVMLAGCGSAVDLADVVAATRRSSSPPALMDRHQFGWAVSRLIGSGLLAEYDHRFAPSPPAIALWARMKAVGTVLSGAELTRSLLEEMRSIKPGPAVDLSGWNLSADDHLTAVRSGVSGLLVQLRERCGSGDRPVVRPAGCGGAGPMTTLPGRPPALSTRP